MLSTDNSRCLCSQEDDAKRTVGINTGHVGTTHFEIETADKDYVVNVSNNTIMNNIYYF